jgi:4-hydroxy-tetrahydrodipicolinate reductase
MVPQGHLISHGRRKTGNQTTEQAMSSIKVLVHGAAGKMGQMLLSALCREPDLKPVGAVDVHASGSSLTLPDGSGKIPFGTDLEHLLVETSPDVLVDFSTAKAVLPMAIIAAGHKVHIVSGTTGLSPEELKEIDRLAKSNKTGAIVASNFAIGAIVMMHLAKQAARYFDYAEIIEEHHNQKLDAPSGTALNTAKLMAESRGKPFLEPEQKETYQESRGKKFGGIPIHSIRLPGIVARQEVILGATGQTLSIKHDAISRECYMPGVMLAIRRVSQYQGLVFGLDTLLNL